MCFVASAIASRSKARPPAEASLKRYSLKRYADMGRTGTSALAHFLDPAGSDAFKAFGKRNAKCIGNHPVTLKGPLP
jgi:hypothetical protein